MNDESHIGDLSDRIGRIPATTDEQRDSVRRHIDRLARGDDDRAMLLEAIGLEGS